MQKPSKKVTAGGIAGTVLTIIVAIFGAFNIVIPNEVQGAALAIIPAVITIVHFVTSYSKKD